MPGLRLKLTAEWVRASANIVSSMVVSERDLSLHLYCTCTKLGKP